MSAWTCRSSDGKAVVKIVPPRLRIPLWKGPGADSEEKHEPASDIDTVAVDSLKALDPQWPIREADIDQTTLTWRCASAGVKAVPCGNGVNTSRISVAHAVIPRCGTTAPWRSPPDRTIQ